MKRLFLLQFIFLASISIWADVRVNSINFPDANFRAWILAQSYGSDGVLTDAEIGDIENMLVSGNSIRNLKGIGFFTSLKWLNCDNNLLTSLDLSQNTALQELDCGNNQLTSLNVAGCTELTNIVLNNNQMEMEATETLVNSLPTVSNGGLYALNQKSDLNIFSFKQANAAKAKGWETYVYDIENGWNGYFDVDVIATEINSTTFPDYYFMSWVYDQSYGKDGVLTYAEIDEVKSIYLNFSEYKNNNIQSLKGIEYFSALESLTCYNTWLYSLDVSKNIALKELICNSNRLTSVNVSKNNALEKLEIYNTPLATLDVSGCTALTELSCYNNTLTSKLTSLDVSKNTALKKLSCHNNQLTSLNVSGCVDLTTLSCENNELTSLDVSECAALKSLNISSNQITTLDLSHNATLKSLKCYNNMLTSLDVSGCTNLNTLYCYQNQIKGSAMDMLVESLPTYKYNSGTIYVIYNENEGNVITNSQIVVAKAKRWMPYYFDNNEWCEYEDSNPGIEINATNFPDENFRNWLLSQSYGSDSVLTDEEIANVTSIWVNNMSIESLAGIEFFTALTRLQCYGNHLTALDVSKNTLLTGLFCSGNELKSLDVSQNTALQELNCGGNQLTSIDVSNNPALYSLQIYDNRLTSLDVSMNTNLRRLECYRNQIKGEAMDNLIASMPTTLILYAIVDTGYMYVIYNENEGNEMTATQVAAVKAKRWLPYYFTGEYDEFKGTEIWAEYTGSKPTLRGDVNGDGIVNGTDIQAIINLIVENRYDEKGDVNEDGNVNGTDIQEVINYIVYGPADDTGDDDNDVDEEYIDQCLPAIMEEDPSISIFCQALKLTNIADYLNKYVDYSYSVGLDSVTNGVPGIRFGGRDMVAHYTEKRYFKYTAFVETNEVLKKYGINSLEDLIAHAKSVYDETFPSDAGLYDNDYTNRKNPLNRWVSYHLMNRYGNYSDWAPYGEILKQCCRTDVADAEDFWQTMLHEGMIRFCRADGQLYANRKGLKDVVYQGLKGVRVLTDDESGDINQQALNGRYFYIEDLLEYDTNVRDKVLNCRMRIDATTLSADFMNQGSRGNLGWEENYLFAHKRGYIEGWKISPETFVGVHCDNVWWSSYLGNAVAVKGQYDVQIKLPNPPPGLYEIRLAYVAGEERGVVQVYLNNEPCGIPVDLRLGRWNLPIDFNDYDLNDEEDSRALDKTLRNLGYMLGPDSYGKPGTISFRVDAPEHQRRILTTAKFTEGEEYWLRFRQVLEGDAEWLFDYIELCPVSIIHEEDRH